MDFYLFSFNIYFGDDVETAQPVSLIAFYEMVRTPGPAPAPDANSAVQDARLAQIKFTLTSGLLPSTVAPSTGGAFPSSGATTRWRVKRGTFSCSVGLDFAISSARLVTGQTSSVDLVPEGGAEQILPFYSRPMQLGVSGYMGSEVTLTVYRLVDGNRGAVSADFEAQLVRKDVPVALWGAYDPSKDPVVNPSSATQALSDPGEPTMSLCMGVNIWVRPPRLADDNTMVPFDPSVAFRWKLPPSKIDTPEPTQAILLPSREVYLAEGGLGRWDHVRRDWVDFAEKTKPKWEGAEAGGGEQDNPGNVEVGEEEGPGAAKSTGLLEVAAQALGWNATPASGPRTPVKGEKPTWMLSAKPPKRLIADLATRYPVLPRYTAVTA